MADDLEQEAAKRGIRLTDRDIARRRGDDEVWLARSRLRVLREDMLVSGGWTQRLRDPAGLGMWDHVARQLRLICTVAREDDGRIWAHLSVSQRSGKMLSFEQLRYVKESLFPDMVALQVLPPKGEWYSLEPSEVGRKVAEVLHLFVCLSERPTPDFRSGAGTL